MRKRTSKQKKRNGIVTKIGTKKKENNTISIKLTKHYTTYSKNRDFVEMERQEERSVPSIGRIG
jgi:hypothetical protein